MMVLEVHGSHYSHQEHLGIGDLGKRVRLVLESAHGIFDNAKSRYNLDIVHVSAPLDSGIDNFILEKPPWTLN